MAFGQAGGPPASAKQLARLAELLAAGGYESFREARHPLGLTQRQSNGRFTREEAEQLIEQLEDGAEQDHEDAAAPPAPGPPAARPSRAPRTPGPTGTLAGGGADDVVTAFPDELLAAELVRRGWTCVPPA